MGLEMSRLDNLLGKKLPKIQAQPQYKFEIPKRYESPKLRESNNSKNVGNVNAEIYRCPSRLEIGIDDSAIPDPPPLGSLSFQANYEEHEAQLWVHVIGARRLPTRYAVSQVGVTSHGAVIPCDPVVSVCLLPDDKFVDSYVQYGTQEPDFDEMFVFKVSLAELVSKTLRFTVYDSKIRHVLTPIGHVLYPLKVHIGEKVVEKNIKPNSQASGHSRGLIHVRLQYIPASEQILIGGIEAHKLMYVSLSRPEYFVKITQITNGQKIKTRKTPTNYRDGNPVFKHSLAFSVPQESLGDTSLVVTLLDHGLVRGNKVVGRVVLGPYLFSCDSTRSHWGEMVKFAPQGIEQWHGLYL